MGMGDSTEIPGRFDDRPYSGAVFLRDGFPGQRLRVLPRPLVASALRRPPTSGLLVTDAGYFPRAANHGRRRPAGAPEAIVIVCVDGYGLCDADGRTTVVGPGHAIVLPPGRPHVYIADPERPWTIWWLHAAGTTIDDAIASFERDETLPSLISAAGAGWSLLAQLAADVVAGGPQRTEPVRQAQDYLRRNFAKPLSVAELARTAGLSPSHFSALFRAATGGGVVEYTKRLRMARARELLITSSRGVADIAEAVGYTDAFYFSRQFRTVHGCTPTAYRAAHREA
jgi:AraC-like DNA-binding protein